MSDSKKPPLDHAVDHEGLLREAIQQTQAAPPNAPKAPEPEELAAHFPEFEILELIGRGGMGAVYKTRQPKLDRTVALKVLPLELGSKPEFGERFLREARALASLNHPHVLTVHDFGERNGFYWLLTEFVDGVNLRQLMELGELSPVEALRIAPQMCTALEYAHEQGVVHRDIKPENILIDQDGQVRIADFGLAKLVTEQDPIALTRSTTILGTPRYMAPEQWKSSGSVDHRADIYSLGVVLYEMLTGNLPMGHFDPPSARPGVPRGLDEVVRRTLAQQPENRYQHARDVQSDVEREARIAGRAPHSTATTLAGTTSAARDDARVAKGPFVAVVVALFGFAAFLALVFFLESGHRNEYTYNSSVKDYDATVTAMAEAAREGRIWDLALPEFPSDAPTYLPPIEIAKFAAPAIGFVLLLWILLLGFGAVRKIRNSEGRLCGMPFALCIAWLVPLAAVNAAIFAPIAQMQRGDFRNIMMLVVILALLAADIWFLTREARRQRGMLEARTPQRAGGALLAVGYVVVLLVALGGSAATAILLEAPEPPALTTNTPILMRDLVGRTADEALERLGPPVAIQASATSQMWSYRDPKGAAVDAALTLNGDVVIAVRAQNEVLMPTAKTGRGPYLGQAFVEVARELGSPSTHRAGSLGNRFAWPDGLSILENGGRVVGIEKPR